ncbi:MULTISPECIES: DUF1223 domain-containing protein [Actibacterium]|nr:DUF1223 domain-containing protein [Actibacterium sp. EMB200-NS6]ALG90129.1 hypothetical protein TQ29_07960 [Actibacterium sp. EMB200-NS6]
MRMSRIFRAACALCLILAGPLRAESDAPVVIELFTSQGCSSCPPADALLGELSKREDIIALALHVDYWDYIGWKDKFASPAFTNRQKAYARAAGSRTIYTPQMIVGGADHLMGYRPMDLADLIQAHRAAARPVTLRLRRDGGGLIVQAASERPLDKEVVLQLVSYIPEKTVAITRGENAGRTVRYSNIVTSLTPVARWDGRTPLAMRFEMADDAPVVAILQETGAGPIIAAARLR